MTDGDTEAEERTLRRAAEAGDLDAAHRLGVWLFRHDRKDEAEPWLRRAIHTSNGTDAAYWLGLIADSRSQPEQVERWLSLGAQGGDSRSAFQLAEWLYRQGRPDEAHHWYDVAAKSDGFAAYDAKKRLHEHRVDDAVRHLTQRGDGPGLWRLLLSRPLGEAVRIAAHLRDLPWRPDDDHGRSVLQRLLTGSAETVDRVTERATRLATRVMPLMMSLVGAGAAERRETSTIALTTVKAGTDESDPVSLQERLALVEPTGRETILYSGPRDHSSLGVLDDGVVMGIRSANDGTGMLHWELVRYADGGELVLGDGPGAPYPRLVTTDHGYVVGLRLTPGVVMGGAHERPRMVDLSSVGMRYRTDCLAVDPTGTRIALAVDHILVVVDSLLNALIATTNNPAQMHGQLWGVVFPAPGTVITSGDTGMCRWRIENDALIPVTVVKTRDTVADLFAVPAWGIVAGGVNGRNLRCFDLDSLEPVPLPIANTVMHRRTAYIDTMIAQPGGRFVVYGGTMADGEPEAVTAIYDSSHPLAWVHRPPTAFTRSDMDALGDLLAQRVRWRDRHQHRLAADERDVLDLLHAAARCHLTG